MVLVVVLVHAIAADEVQIRIIASGAPRESRGHVPGVVVIVNGIGVRLADNATIDDIFRFAQANLCQLLLAAVLDQLERPWRSTGRLPRSRSIPGRNRSCSDRAPFPATRT